MFIEARPGESNCTLCQMTALASGPESHVQTHTHTHTPHLTSLAQMVYN